MKWVSTLRHSLLWTRIFCFPSSSFLIPSCVWEQMLLLDQGSRLCKRCLENVPFFNDQAIRRRRLIENKQFAWKNGNRSRNSDSLLELVLARFWKFLTSNPTNGISRQKTIYRDNSFFFRHSHLLKISTKKSAFLDQRPPTCVIMLQLYPYYMPAICSFGHIQQHAFLTAVYMSETFSAQHFKGCYTGDRIIGAKQWPVTTAFNRHSVYFWKWKHWMR